MDKQQIERELGIAYAELQQLEDMYNMADSDFTDYFTYRIKAQNILIGVLNKKLRNIHIANIIEGIKKDTAVAKHDSI